MEHGVVSPFQHFPGQTEENGENMSVYPASRPRFKAAVPPAYRRNERVYVTIESVRDSSAVWYILVFAGSCCNKAVSQPLESNNETEFEKMFNEATIPALAAWTDEN